MNVEFVGLSTFVDAAFWNNLNKRKLNEWKLDDTPKSAHAALSVYDSAGTPARVSLSHESLHDSVGGHVLKGEIVLTNTYEEFNKMFRKGMLQEIGLRIWANIHNSSWVTDPDCLNNFCFTVFADLKKFQYYYWNCFPALCYPSELQYVDVPTPVDSELAHRLLAFHKTHNVNVFLLHNGENAAPMSKLKDYSNCDEVQIVVADPSTELLIPGWPVRNVLAAVAIDKPEWAKWRFISLRAGVPCIQYSYKGILSKVADGRSPSVVGWERAANGKLEHNFVDLKSQFNPVSLMEQSVGLNISLIKWRLVPELRLERFSDLKVLILGAGTLGCNLARGLMGWGVKKFTFVDNSNVSYSNPVRQSLSEFLDAEAGRPKAEVAANALKKIFPTVHAEGVIMTVPMPGHTIQKSDEADLKSSIAQLEQLVHDNDVLFLALDSREARWLPTVLANKYGKMTFSVALGFDTFVIIRHGVSLPNSPSDQIPSPMEINRDTPIPYSSLACYFCSDVTAPGNSTNDRTLDQQCTVSRAGLSMIASGLAVEVLSSVLQYEDPLQAPAFIGENTSDEGSGLLGSAPHQIRGFVFRFQQMTPCVRRFDKCVACGSAVSEAYATRGWEFVKDVMNSPSTLELVTGLDKLHASVEDVDIDFNSDDGSSVVSMN